MALPDFNKDAMLIQEDDEEPMTRQQELIKKYYDDHPLNVIEPDNWNNIPVCLVKSIKLMVEHIIEKDLDNWERKAQINDRFFRLQHLLIKLQKDFKNNSENFAKFIDYQQTTLTSRIKKSESYIDGKFSLMDRDLQNFRKLNHENVRCYFLMRNFISSLI